MEIEVKSKWKNLFDVPGHDTYFMKQFDFFSFGTSNLSDGHYIYVTLLNFQLGISW